MAAALTLIECGDKTRELFLFDTFEGMPPATDCDLRFDDVPANELLAGRAKTKDDKYVAFSPLEDARANVLETGYSTELIHFIKGKVELTIPKASPGQIAILRLDTDWYESTIHELNHLYPLVSPGGVVIIDDYGFWKGARKAVDEYWNGLFPKPLLCRIDETGRLCIKPTVQNYE